MKSNRVIQGNVCCPFCGAKIKKEIPKGLSIKKMVETINKILKSQAIAEARIKGLKIQKTLI